MRSNVFALLLAFGLAGCSREGRRDTAQPFYSRAIALDLNADGRADTIRVIARGTRFDSLDIRLTLLVDGQPAFVESWPSSYELIDVDSLDRLPPRADRYIRSRLDRVISGMKVAPFEPSGDELLDSAQVRQLQPTQEVLLSYGYETTMSLVWNAKTRRFVKTWECC